MRFPNLGKLAGMILILGLGVLWWGGGPAGKVAMAQSSSEKGSSGDLDATLDPYQRSGQVLYLKRMGKSGWQRGQEIYYMKCWICHNDYTIKADTKGAGPTLKGLFKREKLWNGKPVNEETVAAQIREGSPRMPRYGPVMAAQDMADLLAYLKDHCCWDEQNPPANPRYKNP